MRCRPGTPVCSSEPGSRICGAPLRAAGVPADMVGGVPRSRAGHVLRGCAMRTQAADIGLAIIGGGRVGLFRGEVANRHPAVKWIGLAEKNPNRAGDVAPKIGADFVTQSHVELLQRPEVT